MNRGSLVRWEGGKAEGGMGREGLRRVGGVAQYFAMEDKDCKRIGVVL